MLTTRKHLLPPPSDLVFPVARYYWSGMAIADAEELRRLRMLCRGFYEQLLMFRKLQRIRALTHDEQRTRTSVFELLMIASGEIVDLETGPSPERS
ncbi:hypothetical protein [Rhizobium tubonense]|uniref:Uncharacterized protein n=1 Tax=Rhizobium tubonense TaxID=484088 RepID=A0A2W4EYS5_9HYPH|nr:hypothetical protein [Rhizobium tubonense]PZM15453.1 hypothetical protein CPY51_06365 [Rhizobium tubonense]